MQPLPLDKSVALIPDGASLMIGGFMAVGTPLRVIDELVRQKKTQSHSHCQRHGHAGPGNWQTLDAKLLRKAIVSHIGLNPETQRQMLAGELEVELVPQGTLIERIRAGGFGLGGVLTQTGIGTSVEEGKQRIEVAGGVSAGGGAAGGFRSGAGLPCGLHGQSGYALTARNFNPVIAMAADTVIASADHIVPVGVLAPDHVMTPAPVVDYLVAHS